MSEFMIHLALVVVLTASGAARPPPQGLRELAALVGASPQELSAATRATDVARLRAARERQQIIQSEIDTVERVQRVLDATPDLVLMPHELARLSAESALLAHAQENAEDESLALRAQLGSDGLDAAEGPWSPRQALDPQASSEAAQRRARPGARATVAASVRAELSHVARAEHRLIDVGESVLPETSEALTSALIDLPDGGALLDVIEAMQRQAEVRLEQVELREEREEALVRLRLLTGGLRAPAPSRLSPSQLGSAAQAHRE